MLIPVPTGKRPVLQKSYQVGFGKSSKPDVTYHFDELALNSKQLLDFLGIGKPPRTNASLLKLEMAQTESSYRKFIQSYFPNWSPAYENFVGVYVPVKKGPDYRQYSIASVRTYQMIAEQPIVGDLHLLRMPVLLVIGQRDHTVFGRRFAPPEAVQFLGNYRELGPRAVRMIPNASLAPIQNSGHVPHLEAHDEFMAAVLKFPEKTNHKRSSTAYRSTFLLFLP